MSTHLSTVINTKMGAKSNTTKDIESIVRYAGQMIKNNVPAEVSNKAGIANFVTEWDVKIQKYLIQELSAVYPDASYFGEEETEGNSHVTSGRCFFIDPIDGTTNYIFGYNHSCVSVGMSLDGIITEGYIYNPFTDDMYTAKKGMGAYLNGRRLLSGNLSLDQGIVAFGCARYNEGDTDALFSIAKELYLNSLSLRNGGSAALDLCRVASGANTAYIELMLQPYDYAAASVIIEESGGVIAQVDGSRITINKGCSILAGSPKAVEQVREVCKKFIT